MKKKLPHLICAFLLSFGVIAQNYTLVKQKTYSVKGAIKEDFYRLDSGVQYKLVTSGIWSDATNGNYDTRYIIKPSFKEYTGFMTRFFAAPTFLQTLSPSPVGYNDSTHVYTYYFKGDSSVMKLNFYDNGYSDNFGSVTFALYKDSLITEKATALHFDGVDDYVSLGNTMNEVFAGVNKKFTIETWINPETLASTTENGKTILAKYGNSVCSQNLRQFTLSQLSDGKIAIVVYGSTGGTIYKGVKGNTVLPLNTWSHVAVTYDGSVTSSNVLDRIKIYINGKLETSTQYLTSGAYPFNIPTSTAHLGIGHALSASGTNCSSTGQKFHGTMDELRIWKSARTCSEIASSMNCTLTGSDTNLVAFYNFKNGLLEQNNSSFNLLENQVDSLYDGTLYNFDLIGNRSNWADGSETGVDTTVCNKNYFINCSVVTDLNETLSESEKFLYPNPATDILNFASSLNLEIVTIYNLQLQAIETQLVTDNKINVGHLPQGVYVITSGTFKVKFIKN